MADEILQQAFALLERGDKDAAKNLLTQFINQDPLSINAWYGLSFCVDDTGQKKECLRRVLAINPNIPRVQALLDDLEAGKPFPQTPDHAKRRDIRPIQDAISQQNIAPISTLSNEPHILKNNIAGQSTRTMAKKRKSNALLVSVVGLLIVAILGFVLLPNAKALGIGGTGILIILIILYVAPDIIKRLSNKKLKESKQATRGAIAEEKIGALLERLGPDYFVLHDVDCDNGNIDHIVFSKAGGIFMIETKSHGGKVTIENDRLLLNGHNPEKNFIAQSLSNSFWLRDKLEPVLGTKPWVTPILVFTNAFVPYAKPVKGVRVVNKKFLLRTIQAGAKDGSSLSMIWKNRDEIIKRL